MKWLDEVKAIRGNMVYYDDETNRHTSTIIKDAVLDRLIAIVERAKEYMDSIDAEYNHKCKKHPSWCMGHDIGCDEAVSIVQRQGIAGKLLREAYSDEWVKP